MLDIGCGNGALCGILKKDGLEVVGMDHDERGCALARQAYPDISFLNLGVYDDPLLAQTLGPFDCVVSTEVVEHLFSPQFLPQFAANVLKPEGWLVASTPYHGYLKNLALSLFNHWDVHHTPLWEGGHIKFWSKKTLTALFEQNGFTVTDVKGVGRIPGFWKSIIITAKKNAT